LSIRNLARALRESALSNHFSCESDAISVYPIADVLNFQEILKDQRKIPQRRVAKYFPLRLVSSMSDTNLLSALNWRYATKEFDADKPLAPGQLDLLLETLRLSASSFGLQPWKFVVVEDKAKRESLVEHSWGQRQVVDSPALIVLCRPTSFSEADIDRFIADTAASRSVSADSLDQYSGMMKGFLSQMSPEAIEGWIKNQIYLALGGLLTACAVEGIDSCPMEGFTADKYDEILGLTEKGLASVVLCPVGTRAASDKYADLAKVRYAIGDVVERM